MESWKEDSNTICSNTSLRRQLLWHTLDGYVFWCLFQALAPMIWFYPLNELDITGYEVFSIMLLTPIITESSAVIKLLQSRHMMAILRLLSVASLASFQAPSTLLRLIILTLGTTCALLVFTLTLWSPHSRTRSVSFWGIILGLFSFLVSRVWFLSFVPVWWNETTNTVIISIAVVVTVDHIVSDFGLFNTNAQKIIPKSAKNGNSVKLDNNSHSPEVPHETTKIESCQQQEQLKNSTSSLVKNGQTQNSKKKVPRSDQIPSSPPFVLVGLGFGSLIFLTEWVFGEVSLISRWVVEGYPDHGPLPYMWGLPVLLALGLGVYLSSFSFTKHILWWIMGVASFFALYYLKTWLAYAGGLFLAVFTLSIWPHMVDRATQCPPGRTMMVSMLSWIVQMLFFVWTIAYNFVPGGYYTREHTDYLIIFNAVTLLLGYFIGSGADGSHVAYVPLKAGKPSNETKKALLILLCIGILGFGPRYQSKQLKPAKPTKIFTAAIWTFHFGYDNYGWPSMERAEKLLRETGADFITLLESDASKPFLGNNDLGMWFGEKLKMYVDFGPATKKHTWGNLILSKYPIVNSTHHLLPSPDGELAPAISATINITGNMVDFVVTHMGNHRDTKDRKQQALYLSRLLGASLNPAVFLGYVTSSPYSRDYLQLLQGGAMKDIDPSDQHRWCQYIMYKKLIRLSYARISRGELSDTEIQMAKFEIPSNPSSYTDRQRITVRHDDVPRHQRFSVKFGHFITTGAPSSQLEHRYHMATPKYFV